METIEIATLKDNIRKYLSKRPDKRETLEATCLNLNIVNVPVEVVRGYVEEMVKDGVISCISMSGNRTLLILEPQGEKLDFEGGYVKRHMQESESNRELEEDKQISREKTKLEINHLKLSYWLSICAFIISIIAILVSIFKK
jgi:hypothetical protein